MNGPNSGFSPDLPTDCVSVSIGQWKVVKSPIGLKSILGSCLGVALHDRVGLIGGLAHILLPDSRGSKEHPGRYADTALPSMVAEICRLRGPIVKSNLVAKITGGAKMFETQGGIAIGESNQQAVLKILNQLKITVVASDVGGDFGRNIVFNTRTGKVYVRRPGSVTYEI